MIIKAISRFCNIQKVHADQLNQRYKEYIANRFKIYKPRDATAYHVSQDYVLKQHKEIKAKIHSYIKEYKFAPSFDTKAFIKLISEVSYVYDNKQIIQLPEFQTLMKEITESAFRFEDPREIALLINFCSVTHITGEEVWFALKQQTRNYLPQFTAADRILILQSANQENINDLKEFFISFETSLLEHINKNNDHLIALQTLEVYAKNKIDLESLFFTIKSYFIEHMDDMKVDQLMKYLQFYSQWDNITERAELLEIIQQHLYKIMRFLNKKEILLVYFIYVKSQAGSEVLFRLIEDRIFLLVDELQLDQIEKLLIVAANQKNKNIFSMVEALILRRLADIKASDIVSIAILFMESNYASEDLITKLESHLISALYNVTIEELPDLIWSLSQRSVNWMEKIADAISERVPDMSIKIATSIVWMTSDYFKSLSNQQKQQTKLLNCYQSFEAQIYHKFSTCEAELRDIALVLSAYVRNLPISIPILDLMDTYIMNSTDEELQELDGWALSQMVWGFSQLAQYQSETLLQRLLNIIIANQDELTVNEFLISTKSYVETKLETQALIDLMKEKTLNSIDHFTLDQVYIGIYIFTNTQFTQIYIYTSTDLDAVLQSLIKRMERLKIVQIDVDPDDGVKEYNVNMEYERYKQQ